MINDKGHADDIQTQEKDRCEVNKSNFASLFKNSERKTKTPVKNTKSKTPKRQSERVRTPTGHATFLELKILEVFLAELN